MENKRGYFGIAIYHPKKIVNIGTLCRSAKILGASFVSIIGNKFNVQCSDTIKSWKHFPIIEYENFEDFYKHIPYSCQLVAVELTDTATNLVSFKHPERVCYLLGAEDHGIPESVLAKCKATIKLYGESSLNVSVAGSIVMHHRLEQKFQTKQGVQK